MIPKEDSIEPIKAAQASTTVAVKSATSSSSTSSTSSTNSSSSTSSSSESSSASSSDNVNLSSQAQKDAERQRIEEERQEALRQLEEERKERERLLEEEHQAKEKALEEERQAKLKALEEEAKRKEEALKAQQLKDQERAAKEAALKAEVEAKKKALEEEMAAKKKALEEEMADKKKVLDQEMADKKAGIESDYQARVTALNGPTLPPNFNEMSPEEQYNYLHDVFVAMAGGDESQWLTGNREVNLIGIRSWQDGQATSQQANKYDDTIYAVRLVDGKPEVYAFDATVDAGVDPGGTGFGYTDPNGRFHGYSHLADGFYAQGTFTEGGGGHWGVDTVLRQSGNVRINVDMNNDAIIEENERLGITEGAGWGICFHPGGSGENVGSWSAGCQVIRREQYGLFQQLLQESPNSSYAYALIDSSNLPQVDANHVAVGVPNTPVVTGTGGTSVSAGSVSGSGTTASPGTVTAPPLTANIPLPTDYQAPSGASPHGASDPFDAMQLDAQNADQQLMSLCMEALKEINDMRNNPAAALQSQGTLMGPATMMLYATYVQTLMQKITLQPQTEEMVSTTLAMVGVNVDTLKQIVTAQNLHSGGAPKTTAPSAGTSTTAAQSTTTGAATQTPAAQQQQQLNS
jgi:hypothetical protein